MLRTMFSSDTKKYIIPLVVPAVLAQLSISGLFSGATSIWIFKISVVLAILVFIYSLQLFFKDKTGKSPFVLMVTSIYMLGVLGLWMYVGASPQVSDVSTDLENPPAFVNALNLPENMNQDLSFSDLNKQTVLSNYPKLVGLKINKPIEETYAKILELVPKQHGFKVTYQNDSQKTLEFTADHRFFKFQDDVVIRLTEVAEGQTLIDMRSKSRLGRSDQGANARRIILFYDLLEQSLGLTPKKR